MTTAALVFAGLAGLLHVYIWVMESLTWRKPATWKRFGVANQEEAEVQRTFAYNQGFYNLFLALVVFIGILHVPSEHPAVGWPLILAGTGCMFGAALVLASCGKQYARPAILQGTFPLITLVLAILIHA